MHSENWDDLRYVLCVANTGSVLQAAKRLGVNHATVLRHVTAFEERHGASVFERTAHGYQVLPDSAHIIQAAQVANDAMQEVARLAAGGKQVHVETIRINSTDTICNFLLTKFIAERAVDERADTYILMSSNNHTDLSRDQADIVVRPSLKLADDLVGHAAGELRFAAYASDPAVAKWLRLSGPLTRSIAGKWSADNVPDDQQTTASDSFITLAALAASGAGIAILPTYLGDNDARLIRLRDAMPVLKTPLWVAQHADAVESPRMRLTKDLLQQFLSRELANA